MIHPELYCHANSKIIEFWTYLWRKKSLESILHINKKRLWKLKLFRINKKLEIKNLWFIIESMSHPEKAKSSCYLGKSWPLRIDYSEKKWLESKTSEIFFIHIKERMSHPENFTSPCYLANYRFLRIDYGTKIVQNQKNYFWKKMTFIIGCMNHSKKLNHHAISEIINFWDLFMKKIV